jgi:hypothetical protein
MFSLYHLIMSSNYLTPLDTHDAPTSFPSSIIEGHLNIFLLMNNNPKKCAIEIT